MKKISKQQQTINNLVELGRRYLELSKFHYGWTNTYSHEDETLDDNYSNHLIYLYFATNSDHTAFHYKDIDISYQSTPTITLNYNILDDLESEYLFLVDLFNKIQEKLSNKTKEEGEKEKQDLIDGLEKQLKSLKNL